MGSDRPAANPDEGDDFKDLPATACRSRSPRQMNPILRSAALLSAVTCLVLRADLVPAENLLPEDTLAALSIPDATIARAQFNASNFGRLWADPAMGAFRTNFETGFRKKFADALEKESGLDVLTLANLAHGQATLALLRGGWVPGAAGEGGGPEWLLTFDSKDRSPKLTETLDAARKKLASNTNAAVKSFKVHDIEFTSVTVELRSEEAGAGSPRKSAKKKDEDDEDLEEEDFRIEFAFGQAGTAFVAATSPGALSNVVSRILSTNTLPGLGAKSSFAKHQAAVFKPAAAWLYADIGAFYEQLSPGLGSVFGMLSMLGAEPSKVIPATGLGSLKTLAAGVRNTPEGLVSDLVIDAPAGERAGLVKVFETLPVESGVPEGIPASATSFQRWRIDGKAAWKALDDALKRISPQISGLAQLTLESAGQVFDSNFNLQRDLSGNLGDDFISYTTPSTGTNLAQLGSPAKVQLIGSPNPARLVAGWKALEALMHMQAGALSFSERTGPGGQKVLVSKVATKGGERPAFQLTTTSNYVVIASEETALDAFLQTATNGLAALPGLSDAATHAGGTTNGMFGFSNYSEDMRPTWEALRTARSLDTLVPSGATSLEAIQAVETWADFKLLPPFEQVARYWTVGALSGGSTPEGFRFRWFTVGGK